MKKMICLFVTVIIMFGILTIPAFADSATISFNKKNVTVGEQVKVTIVYSAGYDTMMAVTGSITYNASVLQYISSSTDTTASGGKVIVSRSFNANKSDTITITFKAISAGAGSISCKLSSFSGINNDQGSASAGATVNVAASQPSSNANLASIKLSDGTLTPEFKATTSKYSVIVKYPTDKISISANAAVGDSTVTGLGTFNLRIGNNKFDLTVTAASGAKKTYTVNVKRMSEAETAEAIEEERKNNPRLIVVKGVDYFLSEDISAAGAVSGYTASSVERKGANIGVLADDNSKYTLYWATDENGENGAFYTADEYDNFTKLNYIRTGEKLYVIEPFEDGINVSKSFTAEKYKLDGENINCYKYSDAALSGFYVFNCYINGKNDYYRYDEAEKTLQREPAFISTEPVLSKETAVNIIDKFNSLNLQAKIFLILLGVAALLVFVLIVLLIIRAAKKGDTEEDEETPETDTFGDFGSVISDDTLIFDTNGADESVVIGQTELFTVPGIDGTTESSDDVEFLDANDNNE